jgi:hypothetical protein
MRGKAKLAIVGTAAVTLGAIAGPALANQSVGVSVGFSTAAPSGARTLYVQDTQGNDLTATGAVLNMSSGSNSFITKVVDGAGGYANTGYTVQAMMSNLYPYNGTAFTSCSNYIASKQLTLSSPTGLLDESGITAGLTPVFSLSGDLTSIIGSTILGTSSGVITNQPVTGIAQSLSQGQIAGSGNTGNLFGTTLANVIGNLPIQIAGNPAGGSFTFPATDPSGATCGNGNNSTATQVPIMTGTANASGLISDLNAVIETATGTTLSGTPTAQELVTANYLDPNAVMSMVCSALSITCALLSAAQQTSILQTLTDDLNTNPITLVSGLTGQTGNYSAQPGMVINTSGIVPGGYRGTMTVTLVTN